MKKFINDFKAFALKGNIVDMAIGVVIGAAFGKIVTSLVNDIITPLISLLTGNVSLTNLKFVFREAVLDAAGEISSPEVALTYGNFLQTVIDFFIIAISIFLFVTLIQKGREKLEAMKKKEEIVEEIVEEAKPTTEELLAEIVDILKERK